MGSANINAPFQEQPHLNTPFHKWAHSQTSHFRNGHTLGHPISEMGTLSDTPFQEWAHSKCFILKISKFKSLILEKDEIQLFILKKNCIMKRKKTSENRKEQKIFLKIRYCETWRKNTYQQVRGTSSPPRWMYLSLNTCKTSLRSFLRNV